MDLRGESDLLERVDRAPPSFALGNARERQRQFNVCKHGLVRNEVIALKHEADGMVSVGIPVRVAVAAGGHSVDDEVARGILIQSADDIQHRGFSASRWT